MLVKIYWVQGGDEKGYEQIRCKKEDKIKPLSLCKHCDLFEYATDLAVVCNWLPERNYVDEEANVSKTAL